MLLSDCVLRHVVVTLMAKLHLNPLHYLLALAGLVGCPSDLCSPCQPAVISVLPTMSLPHLPVGLQSHACSSETFKVIFIKRFMFYARIKCQFTRQVN